MKYISKAWNYKPLQGLKTYISAFLLVVLAGLKALNYIDENTYQVVLSLLVGLGLAALRSAK